MGPRGVSDGRPVKVLLLSHSASLGGAELALLRLVDVIDRSRWSLSVVLFEHGPLEAALRRRNLDVVVLVLPPSLASLDRRSVLRVPLRAAAFGVFVLRVRKTVRALDPVVVQTGSMKAHLVGLLAVPGARKRLVCYLHDRLAGDYMPRYVAWGVNRGLRQARTVLANSRATALTVSRHTTICYPGFAPEQARPREEVLRRGRPRQPVVLMVGRIGPTKGQGEFVRAAALVRDNHPDARFVIAGAPLFGAEAYEVDVRQQAASLGLGSSLEWWGQVNDLRPVLDGATVLVHASPVPEPFGQVVVEAMVRGLPVIATNAGGVPEILGARRDGDEAVGVLVPPGDSQALAAAIDQVLSHSEAAVSRAVRAYDRAVAEFHVARTAAVVTAVWSSVTKGMNPP